jgi:predicted RNA-binding protein YlxR (DUF448 family)
MTATRVVGVSDGPAGGVDFSMAGRPASRSDARTPVRTCIGCRGRGGRSDLVRVVMVEGALVPDLRARIAGRGAWLHPDPACLDLAVRRRALTRALRLAVSPDVTAVRAEIERRYADQHDG